MASSFASKADVVVSVDRTIDGVWFGADAGVLGWAMAAGRPLANHTAKSRLLMFPPLIIISV